MSKEHFYHSFDGNNELDAHYRKLLLTLTQDFPYMLSWDMGKIITLRDVEDHEGLTTAINCLGNMQAHGFYHGELLGMIDPATTKNIRGKYRQGQVILFSDYDQERGTVVVEEPYPKKQIEIFVANNQLRFTHSTTVNVPSRLVRPIGIKRE